MTFEDGLRLVRQRAEAMAEAGANAPGGMTAILGLNDDVVHEMVQDAQARDHQVWVANYNSPGQVVVAGSDAGLAALQELAQARKARRVVPLAVSVACHTPLMGGAAEAFGRALAETPASAGADPVISNVTAAPQTDPQAIREALLQQLVSPVRWVESVRAMAQLGVDIDHRGRPQAGALRPHPPDRGHDRDRHAHRCRQHRALDRQHGRRCPHEHRRRSCRPGHRRLARHRTGDRAQAGQPGMPRGGQLPQQQPAAEQVVQEIGDTGGEALAVQADVSQAEGAKQLVEAALGAYGTVDILVNNAGITRDGLLMRMSEEDWDAVLDTNLKGAFHCIKAVQRTMLRNRAGRIIQISSISGVRGNAGQANYAAAKAGLIGLTKAMARELASRNITVNAVAPGFVDTDMTRGLGADLVQQAIGADTAGQAGHPGGHRLGCGVLRLSRSGLHHRTGAGGGRRAGYVAADASVFRRAGSRDPARFLCGRCSEAPCEGTSVRRIAADTGDLGRRPLCAIMGR